MFALPMSDRERQIQIVEEIPPGPRMLELAHYGMGNVLTSLRGSRLTP